MALNTRGPIQFEPETVGSMIARFHLALDELFDYKSILAGATRPGQKRANTFDFEDGLRMVVSRDLMDEGKIDVHISGSFETDSVLGLHYTAIRDSHGREAVLNLFAHDLKNRFREISGFQGSVRLLGWTRKAVPHLIAEYPDGARHSPRSATTAGHDAAPRS